MVFERILKGVFPQLNKTYLILNVPILVRHEKKIPNDFKTSALLEKNCCCISNQ